MLLRGTNAQRPCFFSLLFLPLVCLVSFFLLSYQGIGESMQPALLETSDKVEVFVTPKADSKLVLTVLNAIANLPLEWKVQVFHRQFFPLFFVPFCPQVCFPFPFVPLSPRH